MPLFFDDGGIVPLTDTPVPADFRPCLMPMHLGSNFTNHIDFTRQGNKQYWILYAPREAAGLYSLKETCVAAAGDYCASPLAYAWFSGWQAAWAAWTLHCYQRHRKCSMQHHACARGPCPRHPPPDNPEVIQLPSVKTEPGAKRIKLETLTGEGSSRVGGSTRGGHLRRATPAVASDDDDDNMGVGRVPLYDPDTPPEKPRRVAASATKSTPPSGPPSSHTPSTMSSASSLSASTAGPSVVRPTVLAGGAGVPSASSASRAFAGGAGAVPSAPSTSHALAGGAGAGDAGAQRVAGSRAGTAGLAGGPARDTDRYRDTAFFISAAGTIHEHRDAAYKEISSGPVMVAIGWEDATQMGEEIARQRRAGANAGQMEVDA
ncbi:hypothetical protein B0H16DRAFT_1887245 [Mycena metata]|uniref:Uncharacterized protein n=1 Tax=Mycena metata TaxID=1033252 RepID=A0AAD7IX51_9AGAR|nr:hypothetical protein B0H16DRAFT_1887245 [Mycena metata]